MLKRCFLSAAITALLLSSCKKEETPTTPVLNLDGGIVYVAIGGTYKEPGFKASDEKDGDLTAQVSVSSVVCDKADTLEMKYSVKNTSGVTTEASRTVIIYNQVPVASGNYKATLVYPYPGATPLIYKDSISKSTTLNNQIYIHHFGNYKNIAVPAAVVQKTIEGDTLQFGSFQVGDSLNISVTSSRLQSNVIMNYYTVVNSKTSQTRKAALKLELIQ